MVLTNRLRDSDPGLTRRYTPDQANAFQDRVRNAAQAQSAMIDLDPEVLAAMALDFATRRAPFCLPTAQEVRELFEGGGFRIERLSEGVSETGQTLHKTRIYVVATRGR